MERTVTAAGSLVAAGRDGRQTGPLVAAGLALLALAGLAWLLAGPRQALLAPIGGLIGFTLHRSGFGFASGWRRLWLGGEARPAVAQLLLLAATSALLLPALAAGAAFGLPLQGLVFPAGPWVALGGFLFGLGMQLAGGCASGTLYTVGGGSPRMAVVLLAFVAGSVLGTLHLPSLERLPAPPAVSLLGLGWPAALAATLLGVAGLGLLVHRLARGRLGLGPDPRLGAALALAVLAWAWLLAAGWPWGITAAFALWGGKALAALGLPVAAWPGFELRAAELAAPLLADPTTTSNLAIVAGALASAALAGRLRPRWRLGRGELASAVLGGLLLGYGARLAYGCNIGAFLSGIASGSAHGWLGLVCALLATPLGIRLRARLGLDDDAATGRRPAPL